MNEQFYFNRIVGSQLMNLGHAADLIWVIVDDISVHLQADTEIYLGGQRLTQMSDIYIHNRDIATGEREETLFDYKIAALLQQRRKFVVSDVMIDADFNLQIVFTNGLLIRTLPDSILESDDEKWRIFIKGSSLPHIVAIGKSISWD